MGRDIFWLKLPSLNVINYWISLVHIHRHKLNQVSTSAFDSLFFKGLACIPEYLAWIGVSEKLNL